MKKAYIHIGDIEDYYYDNPTHEERIDIFREKNKNKLIALLFIMSFFAVIIFVTLLFSTGFLSF